MAQAEIAVLPQHVEHAELATGCGLARRQVFALPIRVKLPGDETSTDVALRVHPSSLAATLRWLGDHGIKPIGRLFEGPHPGLLWSGHEVGRHTDKAAKGCPACTATRRHVLQVVQGGSSV